MPVPFEDLSAETAVLAGIVKFGHDAYIDAADLIRVGDFRDDLNQAVFACLQELFEGADGVREVDFPTLRSMAVKQGLEDVFADPVAAGHVKMLFDYAVVPGSVRPEAQRLLNLRVARELDAVLGQSRTSLGGVTGHEALDAILALAEGPILDFGQRLGGTSEGYVQIAAGGMDWLNRVFANPVETVGIPTSFSKYDAAIGGGLRRGSISMIAARPKVGKSTIADNIQLHVSGTLGIPSLNLDTEMSQEEHLARIIAHLTGIASEKIERGAVTAEEAELCRGKMRWLETIPYYYECVADKTFLEHVAIMRRWCVKHATVVEAGVKRARDAVIVYDYLQLMDGDALRGEIREYQMLGFMMVALHRLAIRHDVALLALLQLNRDGIDNETTKAAAGSDRIVWKCGNFTVLREKTEEEIAADGVANGDRKLKTIVARHGPGHKAGDYVCLNFVGSTARMTEGPSRLELQRGRAPSTASAFVRPAPPRRRGPKKFVNQEPDAHAATTAVSF